jgi:hypothetical protein
MCTACSEEFKRKEEKYMPLFTIMHIFEVFAKNQYEATDELMRAREGKYEKVYLKKVLVKDAEPKLPREKVNVFADPKPRAKKLLESEPRSRRPAKWGTIFKQQLTGKW